jgi:hypothetical protein
MQNIENAHFLTLIEVCTNEPEAKFAGKINLIGSRPTSQFYIFLSVSYIKAARLTGSIL